MKTIKQTAMLVFLLSISSFAHAQWGYGKPEEIEEMKNRKLIVIKEVASDKVLDKLKKKGKTEFIDDYKTAIDEYNANFEAAISNMWPFHEEYIVKTYAEVEALRKAKNEDYVVARIVTVEASGTGYSVSDGLDWNYWDVKKGVDDDKVDKSDLNGTSFFMISLVEELRKTPIAKIGIPHTFPTKADVAFSIQYTTWYMNARLNDQKAKDLKTMMKVNAGRLKEFTLIVRESDLSEKTTDQVVNANYPFEYKIVTDEEFDNIILEQPEQTAYLIVVPDIVDQGNAVSMVYMPMVIDAKTGEGCSLVEPSAGSLIGNMAGVTGIGRRSVNDRTFKEIGEDILKAPKYTK